jgi:hypothetical protein
MNHKESQLRNDGKNRSILPIGRNIPAAELKKNGVTFAAESEVQIDYVH